MINHRRYGRATLFSILHVIVVHGFYFVISVYTPSHNVYLCTYCVPQDAEPPQLPEESEVSSV